MASLPSLSPLLFLLLAATALQPSSPTPIQLGFRVGLTQVDYGHNLTKLQLIQRSLHRGRLRLERFTEMATIGPGNDSIQAPVFAGDGEFLVNLSIGNPPISVSAIMDTGSDLIWTQCMPCTNCFDQQMPIFDPAKSSTCSNVSCTSDLCKDMNVFKCMDGGCKYLYSYADDTSSEGFMARDTFTFENSGSGSVSIPNIGFGCGVNNHGSGLANGSGIAGLGRGRLSLVSQLGLKKFSYCLTPMGENKTSNVLFGDLAGLNYSTSDATHSTPLVRNPSQPSLYYVSFEGITVGETLLPIPKSTFKLKDDGTGGMIIDSGTTLTYLPVDAFHVLKREFESQMKLRVSERSDDTGLDLCFDLPTKDAYQVAIPKLKLHFEGVDLELPAPNYMAMDPSTGLACLTMGASSGMSIFGNLQQENLLVLHDLEKEAVSFIPTQCDQV